MGYEPAYGLMAAAFFVVLGHNFSVYLKFHGGRGLASLAGILLFLSWTSVLVCFAVVCLSIVATEFSWKRKIEKLFSVIGSQILGRFIGMLICLALLYLLIPDYFLFFLPAILLSIYAHVGRLREYLRKELQTA